MFKIQKRKQVEEVEEQAKQHLATSKGMIEPTSVNLVSNISHNDQFSNVSNEQHDLGTNENNTSTKQDDCVYWENMVMDDRTMIKNTFQDHKLLDDTDLNSPRLYYVLQAGYCYGMVYQESSDNVNLISIKIGDLRMPVKKKNKRKKSKEAPVEVVVGCYKINSKLYIATVKLMYPLQNKNLIDNIVEEMIKTTTFYDLETLNSKSGVNASFLHQFNQCESVFFLESLIPNFNLRMKEEKKIGKNNIIFCF